MKNSVLRFELLLLLLLVAHDKLFHQARLGGHPLKNLYQGIRWNINCWHLNPKRPFHSHFCVLFILAIVAHTYVCCHSVVRVHSSCFSAVRSSFHNAGWFYWDWRCMCWCKILIRKYFGGKLLKWCPSREMHFATSRQNSANSVQVDAHFSAEVDGTNPILTIFLQYLT